MTIKRCRNGHAMTKKNTFGRTDDGKTYECCRTCRRASQIRSRRKRGMQPRVVTSKVEAQRELLRTKVYAQPDSPYRTAMIEAYAAYDAWAAMDKRPQRFGRKYPQAKPRSKAA